MLVLQLQTVLSNRPTSNRFHLSRMRKAISKMAAITEWFNINVTAALHWSCFTIFKHIKSRMKLYWGLKSLHLFPWFHFWALRIVLMYAEGLNKCSMSYRMSGWWKGKFSFSTRAGFTFFHLIALVKDTWSNVIDLNSWGSLQTHSCKREMT